jgi:hypothetical protein
LPATQPAQDPEPQPPPIGGTTATALSAWLAATFPNLYGANAGANNLSGKTNAQVAAFYLSQFNLSAPKVQAQVLATTLNVYATTQSLGGTAGVAYGFSGSASGLGARSYNVGSDGVASGVANNTTCNVYQLLLAVNQKAVNGVLYNGNATLQAQAVGLPGRNAGWRPQSPGCTRALGVGPARGVT